MDNYTKDKKAADELRDTIIQSAVDYVGSDANRTLLAISATLNAGICLVRGSNMTSAMREHFATMMAAELQEEA